jgi:uncharacterized protein
MYLVDVNILLYAVNEDASRHRSANEWLSTAFGGPPQSVGLPWPTLLGFVRVITNPRVYPTPIPIAQAWELVEGWLDLAATWIPAAGPRHRQILTVLIDSVRPTANLLPDTHLAALAIEHGLTVVSADSDFAKFDGLNWVNPTS